MEVIDDSELWMSDEEEGFEDDGEPDTDPTAFTVSLGRSGQAGGFHVRHKLGEKQPLAISSFGAGSKKKPAFHVGCTAVAIIHGTLDDTSKKPASLLVYDFSFFSYRSTRIKDATVIFEFQGKKGPGAGDVTVKKVAPYARQSMMQTTQTETFKLGAQIGASFAGANANVSPERTVEKTTTHAMEITGDYPCDDSGNYQIAQWLLNENKSQHNGIVSLLRTCVLLTRDTDDEFRCIPSIEATPDFKTALGSLFSSRTPDDDIIYDPEYEPYNMLEGGVEIDRLNLGRVVLNDLWDCTFQTNFGEAVKVSRTVHKDDNVEKVETVREVKQPVGN